MRGELERVGVAHCDGRMRVANQPQRIEREPIDDPGEDVGAESGRLYIACIECKYKSGE